VTEAQQSPFPKTTWQLLGTPERKGLQVVLTVDTDAPVVLAAIEASARAYGITLVRQEVSADGS